MKFCVNCANFVLQDKLEHRPDLGLCSRVDGKRDPVTGAWEDGRQFQWAKVVRSSYATPGESFCGSEGKYWVEKSTDEKPAKRSESFIVDGGNWIHDIHKGGSSDV